MAVNEIGSRPDPIVGRAETISQQLLRQVPYTVTDVSTSTTAVIYSDPEMTTPISSPTTDAEGEYEFYLPPGLYSIAFTTPERVNQPPNFRVWNGNGAASNVYVRSDPYIDPRHPSYGNWTTNPTASLQAAVDEWSNGPNPNLLLPSGDIVLTAPIVGGRKNGIFAGLGHQSRLRGGVGGQPMLLMNNTGHVKFSDFTLAPNPSSGSVSVALELRYDSATNTGGAPSACIFSNLNIGGSVPGNLTDGIAFTKTASSADANNDQSTIIGLTTGFLTGAAIRSTHSQSKGHIVYNVKSQWSASVFSNIDNTGNGNAGGHFTILGGTVVACTSSAFINGPHREAINIIGVQAESCLRFFEQVNGTTGLYAVNIIGCSNIGSAYSINPTTGAPTALDPPTDEIIYFSIGTLTVEGCFWLRHLASGAAAPTKGKINLGLTNSASGHCYANIINNNWYMPGTYENRHTLVNRLGHHIVNFAGNRAVDASGVPQPIPDRKFGISSYLGTFTTAARPTSADDLSDGDSIYDSDLDKPAWWRASDSTWRDATGAAI